MLAFTPNLLSVERISLDLMARQRIFVGATPWAPTRAAALTAVAGFNPNSAYCGSRFAPYKHAVRSGERAGRAGVGAAILPLRTSNS